MTSILIVVAACDPSLYGGQATVATTHARLLARRGYGVQVLTTDLRSLRPPRTSGASEHRQDGYEVHRLHAHIPYPHFALVRVSGIRRWFAAHARSFDLAHIHFTREHLPVRAALEAARCGLPFVLQPHGNLHRRELQHRVFDAWFTRRALRAARAVCALQEIEAGQLRDIERQTRIVDLPNGIDASTGSPWDPPNLRQPVVLFVGRLSVTKNVALLVEAARVLAQRGLRPTYRIVGHDAGEGARARELCLQYGLGNAFEFVGPQSHDEVLREMSGAAVYVQPSSWESFSLTTFEAMSLGVPTVVTKGNEIWPLLERGHAAAIAELTPESLADALSRCLTDRTHAETLSIAGRQLASQFTLDRVMNRLERIYREAIVE